MSVLPGIGKGGLVSSGSEQENVPINVPDVSARRKKGNKSLLEISQSFKSIRHDDDKKLRSRSYEPSSGDERDDRTRKKAKTDRSKSLGPVDGRREPKRKQPDGRAANGVHENKNSKSKPSKRIRVRFDSSSEESYDKPNRGKRPKPKASEPVLTGVQYKIGTRKNPVSMETSPVSSDSGSPVELRKRAQPGTHQARLEATRTKARVWAETASDPGPPAKSIDNDKVIKGQHIDPRRGRFQPDNARTRHAQYIAQDKQDGRPKAADKGRRLQSLPAKKEQHASETEDRPVISAPAKDQGQLDTPMPKINTFLPNEHKASTSTQPQPGTSKDSESSVSPRKPKETSVNQQKREPNEPSVSPQKREVKEPSISPQKREPNEGSVSPQKRETKEPSISPQKREPKEPPVMPQKREPDHRPADEKKMDTDKNKQPSRAPSKATGVVDRSEEEEGKKGEGRRRLPADDHGPVNPTPFPIPVSKPSEEHKIITPADKHFKYYASEKERSLANEREKMAEDSPRVPSEKSSKTDKTWTTVKSKATDSKQSNYSYPAGPAKSQTTYELSSVGNTEKKRREVTIVDPKYLRKSNKIGDSDDDEPFMHEYEYSHSHFRHKNFKDMTDEEKIEYFRDQLKMKPEQIRELTFHPKITEPKLIHHAYTGVETVNWRASAPKSGRRPKSRKYSVYKKVSVVPPSQRKSAMLSKLQGVVYRHINQVYGASPRDTRERQFFEKLAQIQIDDMQRRYEMLAEKERKQLESKFRQREQLRRLRRKFEDDAWRRFMTQYVTSKVVEAEYRNRAEFGLPNDLEDRPRKHPQTIRNVNQRRSQFAVTPKRMHRKNERKYANLFRFNTGPVPKSGGKPLKFEGFDTVYLDTEDEHGKQVKKKQNVDALMREARRILDQTDDETDMEETPRKSYPERRRPEKRPHYHRSRRHIADDKSYKSTQTQSTRSKSTIKPPPKTMKELIDRKKPHEAPTNRYKASNFTAMKADLVKDSDLLNKNEQLKKMQSEFPKVETSSKAETVHSESSKPKSIRDNSPDNLPAVRQSPSRSPKPARTQSPAQTKTVTKTTITTVTTQQATNETDDKKEWKVKDGNIYLDEAETQMAIETKRDKIEEGRKPRLAPSRMSNKTDDRIINGSSPTKSVAGSRVPSRISFRGKQEQTVSRDARPPRAPSRVSVLTSDSKNTESNLNKLYGRQSRASLLPPTVQSPAKSLTQDVNGKVPQDERRKSETVFLTETETETVTDTRGKSISSKEPDRQFDESSLPKSVRTSQATIKQISRHNSISSTQPQKHISGRTSVVGIATTNGRVSPTVEKQGQAPKRRESYIDKLRERVQRKESMADRDRISLKDGEQSVKSIDTKQMNGHISPASRHTESDKSAPRTVTTKNVNVTENITETTNSDITRTRQPVKRQVSNEPKGSIDYRDNNLLSNRRPEFDERRSEITENKEKPKSRVKPSQKKDVQKQKKAPVRRRSRSRTPQRDHSKMNGHGDIKMDRSEYETMGHDGHRPSRRSESVERSNRSRKRSTSRGRKTSQSKGRKRSISSERKKGNKGSVGKSRFPDIKKKEGKWDVTARSPVQKVTRSERVEENVTERIITPKPTGANQWKDLVEKYLRQPSPKVGKTEDRSLLDSNIDDDDDDDEMDIFTRAQMKYKLNVDQTDEDDSDAE